MLGELGAVATGPKAASKMSIDGPPGPVAGEPGGATAKPIACPLVLQCGSCRTIVGDTCTIVDLNSELRTITLERMGQGAVVDERLHTSMTGMDYGSTYHLISCVKCQTALGRMYRTTTPELDQWRGQYTFSSDLLAFYEISAPLQSPTNVPSTGAVAPSVAPEATAATPGKLGTTSVLADVEIAKVQKFCLYLYDRIKSLEEALELHRTGSQEVSTRTGINSTVGCPPGKRGRPRKRRPSPQAAGSRAPAKDAAVVSDPEKSGSKSAVGAIRSPATDAAAPSPAVPPPVSTFTTTTPTPALATASAPATPLIMAGKAPTTAIAHDGTEQPIKRGRGRPRKHFPPPLQVPSVASTAPAAQDHPVQQEQPQQQEQLPPIHVSPPPAVEQSPFCPAPV